MLFAVKSLARLTRMKYTWFRVSKCNSTRDMADILFWAYSRPCLTYLGQIAQTHSHLCVYYVNIILKRLNQSLIRHPRFSIGEPNGFVRIFFLFFLFFSSFFFFFFFLPPIRFRTINWKRFVRFSRNLVWAFGIFRARRLSIFGAIHNPIWPPQLILRKVGNLPFSKPFVWFEWNLMGLFHMPVGINSPIFALILNPIWPP